MNWKIDWKKVFSPLHWVTALVVFLLDQGTKWLVVEFIPRGSQIELGPSFNLVHTKNRGAAFGMFHDSGDLFRLFFFGIVTLVCLYLLFLWLSEAPETAKFYRFCLSLILGGAFGNLLDRAVFGEVTDFIDVYYQSYHWPAFNIADSAISVGATCLVASVIPWTELAKRLKLKKQ